MFSQTAEYALRAMSVLAERHPQSATTQEIAEATRIPKPYLTKVLQELARHDILQAHRGVGGGISLAYAPHEITILDVVNAVDPICRIENLPAARC